MTRITSRRPGRRTTRAGIAAAVALALGAAGCGATTEATKVSEAVADESTRPGGDLLPLGRGAVSPFVDYGTGNEAEPTKVGVRVHAVRKGRVADFEGFTLDRRQRRSTPYYVEASYRNLGSFALSRRGSGPGGCASRAT